MSAVKDFLLYRWKVEWAFQRVVDTIHEHPIATALIFAEGLLLGWLIGVST